VCRLRLIRLPAAVALCETLPGRAKRSGAELLIFADAIV